MFRRKLLWTTKTHHACIALALDVCKSGLSNSNAKFNFVAECLDAFPEKADNQGFIIVVIPPEFASKSLTSGHSPQKKKGGIFHECIKSIN